MDIGDWTSGQTRDICKSGQNLEFDMCTLVSGLVKALIVVSLSSLHVFMTTSAASSSSSGFS